MAWLAIEFWIQCWAFNNYLTLIWPCVHVHTGISCTYWYIIYILVYHVHTGISCTYWYIMYILIYHVHTGISCTYWYIMYILVYLCVFTSCIFFNSFVSSCALTWIFPKEKWLFQHNLKFYKKPCRILIIVRNAHHEITPDY